VCFEPDSYIFDHLFLRYSKKCHLLSSVREKAMRDLERTKERKFRKYAQTLDPRYKSSDKSMEYDNTKITTILQTLFFYQMHFQVDVVILTRVLYFLFL
jgi:hypothetical protein